MKRFCVSKLCLRNAAGGNASCHSRCRDLVAQIERRRDGRDLVVRGRRRGDRQDDR